MLSAAEVLRSRVTGPIQVDVTQTFYFGIFDNRHLPNGLVFSEMCLVRYHFSCTGLVQLFKYSIAYLKKVILPLTIYNFSFILFI